MNLLSAPANISSKDVPLREDVRLLGRILGDTLSVVRVFGYFSQLPRIAEDLHRSLASRTSYIDPLNHLQVALLHRHRTGDHDERAKRGIHLTINGIAAGLRNSG